MARRRLPRIPFPVPAIRAGGWQSTGYRLVPMTRPPVLHIRHYQRVTGVPLQPSSGQAVVSGGIASVSLGPSGLGNIWYPTQITVATTTGPLDTSTCSVYLGPSTSGATLLGQVFSGNGVLAAALPPIQPGEFLIAAWTAAHNGDTAIVNIQGTMDALA